MVTIRVCLPDLKKGEIIKNIFSRNYGIPLQIKPFLYFPSFSTILPFKTNFIKTCTRIFLLGKRCGTTFLPVSTNMLETQPFWEFGYQTFSETKSQYNWVPEFEEQFLIFDVPDEVILANLREIGLK